MERLVALFAAAGLLCSAHGAAAQHPTNLSPRLWPLLHAPAQERQDIAAQLDIIRDRANDRVLLQLQRMGAGAVEALARRHGAEIRVQGIWSWDIWVPLDRLECLAADLDPQARLVLPRRPRLSLGAAQSEGVVLTSASLFHDAGITGADVHVAVIDLGFGGWQSSANASELAVAAASPPAGTNPHGTVCAEIISDMAPGVILHPIQVATNADLEAFVAALPGSGIQIISDSLVWTEDSFGDGTGPHCELADMAREAGVVWVTSAGNRGNGSFYMGELTDEDDNGVHEFAPGDEHNEVTLASGERLRLVLDWDDYPETASNLDLLLYSLNDGDRWTEVASSRIEQEGSDPPWEILSFTAQATGTYGVVIESASAGLEQMPLRIFATTGVHLEHWQAQGSLEDPAHCENIVTVGAITAASYASGTLWPDSGRGPTTDGRVKPNIVAPTSVQTSIYPQFVGTSASSPHVAGALALYVEITGLSPVDALELLYADAEPLSSPVPNNLTGFGSLQLRQERLDAGVGAECESGPERCNGVDDDCDGQVDEELECRLDGGPDSDSAEAGPQGTQEAGCGCQAPGASQRLAPWWALTW